MNCPRQAHQWLALFAVAQMAVSPLSAQDSTSVPASAKSPPTPANNAPPVPQVLSPVNSFRQLLAMKPQERRDSLTNRPPEIRERILAKVREYLALDPNERELRLRATELRWYLMPLLRESPTNLTARLEQVPDDLRGLVQSRLAEWSILPPSLQKEFLDNEGTLHYFSHVDSTNSPSPGGRSVPNDADQARWNALSENDRHRITSEFTQFFDLTQVEKQKTLKTLSDAERAQMDKTLQTFDQLPPAQRRQCINAFTQFAGMSPAERAEFLKNAERWAQLPPKERQAWRDLVAQVPLWPPLPNAFILPPAPPRLPPHPHPAVATNRN
ncbi:MAG TPA: DUF3106 domain-containing protein [Verrucomicrobiae bacterium]